MENLLGLTPECFYKHANLTGGMILEKKLCEIIIKFIRKTVLFSQKTGHDIEDCIAKHEEDLRKFTGKSLETALELAKILIIQNWNNSAPIKQEPNRHSSLLAHSTSQSSQEREAA